MLCHVAARGGLSVPLCVLVSDGRSHKAARREKRLCVVPVYTDDKQEDIPTDCNTD